MDAVPAAALWFVAKVVEEGDACATDWPRQSGRCSFRPA